MKRFLFSFVACALLAGAGCLISSEPQVVEDPTPGVNEANCMKSGGVVDGNACACPEGFFEDPAGFCLDAQGHLGNTTPST